MRFARALNLTDARIRELVCACGAAIVGKEEPTALPHATIASVKEAVIASLTRFHDEFPQAIGTHVESQRKAVAPALSAPTFAALLRELADRHAIEIRGTHMRLPQHVATANPADEKMWRVIKPLLDHTGFNVPRLRELAVTARISETTLKDLLHRKTRTGEVFRVGSERFYPRGTLAQFAAIAQALAGAVPDGKFTVAQFRDGSAIGRSLAMEVLECLNTLGIIQRIGDLRKIRKDFVPILGAATAPPASATAAPCGVPKMGPTRAA
jgi:selenocysteine-specific elongation factor